MPSSPLDGILQQIYDERPNKKARYLLTSRIKEDGWNVVLWAAPDDEGRRVWAGLGDDERADELADAIRAGMMHVEDRPNGGLKLIVHVTKTPVSVYLDSSKEEHHTDDLLDGALALLSRPASTGDKSEARALASQLEAKEEEIRSLTAKINGLRATIARQPGGASASQNTTTSGSPVKKAAPPKNASLLQPNMKRRRLVQEEFASSDDDSGSGSEEEDDDD